MEENQHFCLPLGKNTFIHSFSSRPDNSVVNILNPVTQADAYYVHSYFSLSAYAVEPLRDYCAADTIKLLEQ